MNKNMDDLFPTVKKNIASLIEDQEGNVPGNKLLTLGTVVVILGSIIAVDALAAHRSHYSHRSHSSHRSGSTHSSHSSHDSHSSHENHSNHGSHSSHSSHTSHSNTASHSNSLYSSEGDVKYGPSSSSVPGVEVPAINNTAKVFQLPTVNQHIETPNSTPYSGFVPEMSVPTTTPNTQIDAGNLKEPSLTKTVE